MSITFMPGTIDHSKFIQLLAPHLPKVASRLDPNNSDLLHMQLGDIGRVTRDDMKNQGRIAVRGHFDFIDSIFWAGNSELRSAITISYLAHFDFKGRKAIACRAEELLTPTLREVLREYDAYMKKFQTPLGRQARTSKSRK